MTSSQIMMFSGGFASLLAMGAGGLLLLSSNRRAELLNARFAAVVTPHTRASAPSAQRQATRRAEVTSTGALERLERLFGCTAVARETSKSKWWLVLPMALVLARALLEILVAVFGPIVLLGTPVLWVLLSRMWWRRAEAARREQLYLQFPDTLGMLVRAVRVGIPVTEAIRGASREMPAPTSIVMGQLSDQLAVGMPLDEALRVMADRCGLSEYRFFATALTLQAQTGGGLTETLENLADVIRKRLALRARGAALAGEAKMSSGILAVLPLLAAGALLVLDPEYIFVLFNDHSGNKILAAAILMLGGGILSMRHLIRRALS